MSESFEWAIKKDVRNNPIVREVDRDRHREMWHSVGIGVFLAVVLLFSAWQQFELLQYGYRMEQLQRERAEEAVIQRRLRLEIEFLRSLDRIEILATRDLRMKAPAPDEAIVLERRVEPEAPPHSMVARHSR